MFKTFFYYFIRGTSVFFMLFLSQNALAAELTFKMVPNAEIGDNAVLVEVRIDPQSKKLNVVEGTIEFTGTASNGLSVQVENGQSILPLWPTLPKYNSDNNSINFTGGIPNGFDTEGLLFRLLLSPTMPGVLDVSFIDGKTYLNDGIGTLENITSEPLKIDVGEDGIININDSSGGFTIMIYVIIILLSGAVFFIVKKKYGRTKPNQ